MISSSARGYLLLTAHSRGWAAPYQTSAAAIGRDAATTSGSRPVWQTPMIASRVGSACGIASKASMAAPRATDSVGIGDVASRVAAMERLLVRVLEVKVRRDGDKAVTRETLRQIARVADEAVAFVHNDHGRQPSPCDPARRRRPACRRRKSLSNCECRSLLHRFGKEAPVDETGERRRLGEIAHGDERVEVGLDAVLEQRGVAGDRPAA